MHLGEEMCFRAAKYLVTRRDKNLERTFESSLDHSKRAAGANPATFDRAAYKRWRQCELTRQFDQNFSRESVREKRVLDFGCGRGELSMYMATLGVASIDGVDLTESDISSATMLAQHEQLPVKPTFTVGRSDAIPYPDHSFDLILCFDVLEHVMSIEAIIEEWRRILAKGGRIYVWWQPYFHPYGHHLSAYMPLPWAHVVFSPRTIGVACKRIFDMPDYVPRYWDLDEHGNKKNKVFTGTRDMGGVNCLTIAKFERLCGQNDLRIVRRLGHHLSGHALVERVSAIGTRLPFLREFLTAIMIYELEKL